MNLIKVRIEIVKCMFDKNVMYSKMYARHRKRDFFLAEVVLTTILKTELKQIYFCLYTGMSSRVESVSDLGFVRNLPLSKATTYQNMFYQKKQWVVGFKIVGFFQNLSLTPIQFCNSYLCTSKNRLVRWFTSRLGQNFTYH